MQLKKNQLWFATFLLAAMFITSPLKAQVTIGDQTPPKSFSLLELSISKKLGGLRLPQLTTDQRKDLKNLIIALGNPDKANGLVIYNTDTKRIEYWNKTKEAWVFLVTK